MATSSFYKNVGTSTQLQGSASASAAAALASEQAALASKNAAAVSETNSAASAASALVHSNAASSSASSINANAISTAADVVTSAGHAATATANATTSTNAATATAADLVLTNADVVSTNGDATQTAADRVQTGLDVTASSASAAAALVSKNASATSETNAAASATSSAADATATAADRVQTGLDRTATNGDAIATAADRVQTGLDVTASASSASAASTSAAAASASQVSAASSAAAAANSYDQFDDRYLGSFSSNPSVDNDGDPLVAGALAFISTANEMRVFDGGSWIAASSAGGASLINYHYTATASQTTFSGSDDNSNTLSYTVDNLIVTRNGIVLEDGTDFTATNGTSVVLAVAATVNDEINIVAFKSFTTADMVSATNGGTFQSNVTVNGTMTATAFSGDGSALTNLPVSTPTLTSLGIPNHDQLSVDATGNVSFGDNDKAIFGAGSDLQIYHDGSSSRIVDAGTGNLLIEADELIIRNAAGNETKADFYSNGAVGLYYDNAIKLATTATGVDVTGTVQGDALLIDGNATIDQGANSGNTLSLDRTGAEGTLGLFYNGTQTGLISGVSGGGINAYVGSTPSLAMAISSAGNVGIGTTSVAYRMNIFGNGNNFLQFSSTGDALAGHLIGRAASKNLRIQNSENANIEFWTNNTERMRLDSSGNVRINTTGALVSGTEKVTIAGGSSSAYDACLTLKSAYATGGTGVNGVYFLNNINNPAGYIGWNGTTTSYVTSSDYRLKTAVTYDWDATSRLKQLKPARFAWIDDGDDAVPVDGFLAHEVQTVVPEAITGEKDGMRDEEYEVTPAVLDDDGNEVTPAVMGTRSVPDYQGIDQSKLVPLLVKTIQELEARISALEAN